MDFIRRDAEGREHPVLIAVTALFPAGACTLVAGPNGSGKSTLLHLLGAILRPTAGEVLAGDVAISRFTVAHRDRWRRKVGICFQRSELWTDLSALENVMVPELPRGVTFSELRRRGLAVLERVGVAGCAGRPAGMLSVGERQRVALARALIAKPAYVLADEPTAHQDDPGARLTLKALTEEAQRGATVVITSHDQRVLTGDCTGRRYRLAERQLLSEAPP
jgi:putative ABC transport system ATP-binding protein